MSDVRLRDLNPAEFDFGLNVAGQVGIGNTNPGSFHSSGDRLVIGAGSDEEGITIYSSSTSNGVINFADVATTSSYQGRIIYDHSDNAMTFHAGGSGAEYVRITTSGKVGIGTTSVAAKLVVAGNSDSGDEACAIHIIDNDSTSGSAIPSVSFRSGESTQIYAIQGNDIFGLQFRKTDNSTVVTFDPDGKVGIGETDPSNFLHVNSAGISTVGQFKSTSSVAKIQFNNSGGNACFIGSHETNLVFFTNNAEKMRITNDGKVGIGVDSPSYHLHIKETTTTNTYFFAENTTVGNAGIKLKNSQGEWTIIANDRLRFIDDDSGVERMNITSTGRVGINTTSPEEALHVVGNLKVTGSVSVGESGFNVSTGCVIIWAGGTIPSGFLECNGGEVSRSTYSDLFAVIGTTYGAGNGSSTFNLPDLAGRVVVGEGGNTAGRTPAALESVSDTSGEQSVSLNVNQLPAHSHPATTTYPHMMGSNPRRDTRNFKGMNARSERSSGSVTGFVTTIGDTGENAPINNIQPSMVMKYMIKT